MLHIYRQYHSRMDWDGRHADIQQQCVSVRGPPLPDEFEEICSLWQNGEITLWQATETWQMPPITFYNRATRYTHLNIGRTNTRY